MSSRIKELSRQIKNGRAGRRTMEA
jgi:hypothetical protein